jgi:hypothetical protein
MTAQQLVFAPPYVPPMQQARQISVRLRSDVTARRVRMALLTGPLALKGQRCHSALLLERCEDIPGADVDAVSNVLEALMKQRVISRAGQQFWRVA